MGSRYRVTLARASGLDAATLRSLVEAPLQRVEALMSTYREDSELARLARAAGRVPVPLSPATLTVLRAALRVSAQSAGAFDPTVAPLVDAWGFGPLPPRGAPDASTQRVAADLLGWQTLRLDAERGTLSKQDDAQRLDLSGIAKGHAVDRVAAALREAGIADAVIEVGGEVRALGRRGDGAPWRVAIEWPAPGAGSAWRVLALGDAALATSGTYRNYRELDGRRVSHTIDPRSGQPIDHRLASVTVLADSAMLADAWATALLVLGGRDALRVATDRGLAAVLIEQRGGDFVEQLTPAMTDALRRSA